MPVRIVGPFHVPIRVLHNSGNRLSGPQLAVVHRIAVRIQQIFIERVDGCHRLAALVAALEEAVPGGIHARLSRQPAAADAGATLISPFVGRILDWYKKDTGKDYQGADDPGVRSVTRIYNYFKKFGYKTVVMGASFRNIGEIEELAGCDLLTISPHLLEELEAKAGVLERKLDPEKAKQADVEKLVIDKATFDKMHAADRMAHDKLKEGIEGFSAALENLEKLLAKRLAELGVSREAVGAH